MLPGRNDSCPCGSGKKYKKCCGSAAATAVAANTATARAAEVKRLDQKLDEEILAFAERHGLRNWLREAIAAYLGDSTAEVTQDQLQLALPWAFYHYVGSPDDEDHTPIAQRLRVGQGNRLSPAMHAVLDAQLDAWLSLWEVQQVTPGVGMTLKDLLTGEERFVHEVRGTQDAVARLVLLARVVTCGDVSFIGGIHTRPLPPTEADMVVRAIRRLCHVRTKRVAKDKLLHVDIQTEMIDAWSEAVDALDHRPPPTMQNTDGDPLLLTSDHFEFKPNDRSDVIQKLASLPGAEEPESEDGDTVIHVTRPGNARLKAWENTVIGRILITGRRLKVETNSTARANALRALVEKQLDGVARHRLRDEASTAQLMRSAQQAPASRAALRDDAMPPEIRARLRELKEEHMLGWVDESIPALGGLTPRQATASPASRRKLELLLRDFEFHEARLPADERFDIGRLRKILGVSG